MISNYEFIKAQSFEVAWAIFRCTELFSQSDLRKKLEAAAVELTAEYDAIGDDMTNEFPRIEKLISLVRLAESVGQIAAVNANVLYRELDNLAKATRLEIVTRRDKKNIVVSLENIFTNSVYVKNLTQASAQVEQKNEVASSANEKSEASQFGSIESLLSAATQSSQPMNSSVIPAEAGIQNSPSSASSSVSNILSSYIKAPSANSAQVTPDAQIRQSTEQTLAPIVRQAPVISRPAGYVSPSAGSWQHVILQKVKDLNQTTTKELTANFPEISERTIRFYLQKLVDTGLIDRIGSTGPGAAYRAKG